MKKALSILILLCFSITSLTGPNPVHAQEFRLPAPGVMVHLSPPLAPPILKGIKVHPDNPFRFDFILDVGDGSKPSLNRRVMNPPLQEESTRLIKYFLASLTIPEKDLWVNLSPYEKDRIIPHSFGLTEMGRDLLAEDYMLKQITASLIYPEGEVGKRFWKEIYAEAAKKFGTTNIPVNTFNKVWIVPEKAVVYENAKAGAAYVVESKLKVMLEQDYLAMSKNSPRPNPPHEGEGINALGSKVVREIIIPELTREVNEDKNFAPLRQVYNSLILARWYKKKIKDSILAQVYENKSKTLCVQYESTVLPMRAGSHEKNDVEGLYQEYLKAFKKGAYNYIKEELDPISQQMIPRKYFSGGLSFGHEMSAAMISSSSISLAHRVLRTVMAATMLWLSVDLHGVRAQMPGPPAVALNGFTANVGESFSFVNVTPQVLSEWAGKHGIKVQMFNDKDWKDKLRKMGKSENVGGYAEKGTFYLNAPDPSNPPLRIEYHELLHEAHFIKNDDVQLLKDLLDFKRSLQANSKAFELFNEIVRILHENYDSESAVLHQLKSGEITPEEADSQLNPATSLSNADFDESELMAYGGDEWRRRERQRIIQQAILENVLDPNFKGKRYYDKKIVEKRTEDADIQAGEVLKGIGIELKPIEKLSEMSDSRREAYIEKRLASDSSKHTARGVATEFFAYLAMYQIRDLGVIPTRPVPKNLAIKRLHELLGKFLNEMTPLSSISLTNHLSHFDYLIPEELRAKINQAANHAMLVRHSNQDRINLTSDKAIDKPKEGPFSSKKGWGAFSAQKISALLGLSNPIMLAATLLMMGCTVQNVPFPSEPFTTVIEHPRDGQKIIVGHAHPPPELYNYWTQIILFSPLNSPVLRLIFRENIKVMLQDPMNKGLIVIEGRDIKLVSRVVDQGHRVRVFNEQTVSEFESYKKVLLKVREALKKGEVSTTDTDAVEKLLAGFVGLYWWMKDPEGKYAQWVTVVPADDQQIKDEIPQHRKDLINSMKELRKTLGLEKELYDEIEKDVSHFQLSLDRDAVPLRKLMDRFKEDGRVELFQQVNAILEQILAIEDLEISKRNLSISHLINTTSSPDKVNIALLGANHEYNLVGLVPGSTGITIVKPEEVKWFIRTLLNDASPAMRTNKAKYGGIDLRSDKILTVRNNGQEIKFRIDPAMLKQLENADGFEPVDIRMRPLGSLAGFLGISAQGVILK